jgi:oxalate decarboxylase/phosphoglucose isomerase-like protein (cupin superfamily)
VKPVENLLELETGAFDAQFGRQPFLVRHRLTQHELFSLQHLIELAQRLPASSVEYNAGDVPVSLDPARTPRTGLSVEETLRRIAECRSWMVLKNVEQDPAYRALLEQCLAEVEALTQAAAPGMSGKEGFIFVSSPGSVTPYHMDPEENFLLQIRGHKSMSVFDREDRAILSEEEIERFLGGAHRNLAFREEAQAKARVFELTPGLGVHVPVTCPHWVQNGSEVSVSFSITFQTRASMSRAHAHRMNAELRRWGYVPAPVGRSRWLDAAKQLAYRTKTRVERMLGIGTAHGSAGY